MLGKKSSSIGSCRSCSNFNLASQPMIPFKGEAMLAHVKKGLTKGCHAHAHMHKRQTTAARRGEHRGFVPLRRDVFSPNGPWFLTLCHFSKNLFYKSWRKFATINFHILYHNASMPGRGVEGESCGPKGWFKRVFGALLGLWMHLSWGGKCSYKILVSEITSRFEMLGVTRAD